METKWALTEPAVVLARHKGTGACGYILMGLWENGHPVLSQEFHGPLTPRHALWFLKTFETFDKDQYWQLACRVHGGDDGG